MENIERPYSSNRQTALLTGLENIQKAAALFDTACTGGSAKGCINLGTFYKEGFGVPKDIYLAISNFEKSCKLGLADGCKYLTDIYTFGQGVPIDMDKGLAFHYRTCKLDPDNSACNVGKQ